MEKLKETIFEQITQHLIDDITPSDYINSLSKETVFNEYPFQMLKELKLTEQSKQYHPEGNVWNHTMLVVDEAAKVRDRSKDTRIFMWAALLHDIGKPDTTRSRKGKITSYEHDIVGARISKEFLSALTEDIEFVEAVSLLVKYHMHILYVLKGLPFGDVSGLLREVDKNDIALLCRCDRFGRTGVNKEEEEKQYRKFLSIIKNSDKLEVSK